MTIDKNTFIDMSYPYFSNKQVTPETIREYVELFKRVLEDADEEALFEILESRHSVAISGAVRIIEENSNHVEWFNPDTNQSLSGKDIKWHFWDHYKEYIAKKKSWTPSVINNIDRISSRILSKMENPLRKGPWDRRGAIVANVQSGKTSNYTALITKAADTGYKLIIVLAGAHNSLRSQTQDRLNREFLGYELESVTKATGDEKKIGVRELFTDHQVVLTLTSNAESGDFKTAVAKNAGVIPSVTGDPILMVVKKNPTILRNLIEWATGFGIIDNSGKRVVEDVPILVIDDECDYGSVNIKRQTYNDNGDISDESDPSTTNRLIRKLLSGFEKSIYIGYTATPYANIFIDKYAVHPKYGEDLFPRNFIISLPQPTNYIGPEEVFGLNSDPDSGSESKERLPLIVEVTDSDEIIPGTHKKDLVINKLPDSMRIAIKTFLLTCTARKLRELGVPHNSMLIHVTKFTKVQAQIRDLVEDELKTLTARIMSGSDPLDDFKKIWADSFVPISAEMFSKGFKDALIYDWETVKSNLFESVRNIKIKTINGEVQDTLEYRIADSMTKDRVIRGETVPWEEKGASVIAIGGDKLSRGLTLEGLSVSYYLRSAKMYDTLMQMGRWFGYHDGYADLCRIFTTPELLDWYSFIALANREFLDEIEYMESLGETPDHFGLRIREHPGRLVVTSANKLRNSERLKITYAGALVQTLIFDRNQSSNNFKALEVLVDGIGKTPESDTSQNLHWRNVSYELVTDFLNSYMTHKDAIRTNNPARYASYILKQVKLGELVEWDVVIASKKDPKNSHGIKIGQYNSASVIRKSKFKTAHENKISIGVLTNRRDEILDLSEEEMESAIRSPANKAKKGEIPSGKAIRKARPPERGIILIYFPESQEEDYKYGGIGEEVVGFAISFPMSDRAIPIEYVVNPVYSEEMET